MSSFLKKTLNRISDPVPRQTEYRNTNDFDHPEVQKQFEVFKRRFADRIIAFQLANGAKAPLPAYWNGTEWEWVPRRNRRKIVR